MKNLLFSDKMKIVENAKKAKTKADKEQNVNFDLNWIIIMETVKYINKSAGDKK